jgi:cysteinyl-tRNA synthetase
VNSRRFFLQSAAAAGLGVGSRFSARAMDQKSRMLPYIPIDQIPNHRQLMRDVVIALSDYCKKRRSDFIVLVRNAPELLIKQQREADWEAARDPEGAAMSRYSAIGSPDGAYLNAIDGMVIDGLFFGYDRYDQPTRASDAAPLRASAALLQSQGRQTLSIDYCKDPQHRSTAQSGAAKDHLLAFVDGEGDKSLSHVPAAPPASENPNHVTDLAKAKNFLPLFSSSGFSRRDQWIDALAATNYDALLVDPFWRGSSMTLNDVKALKFKRLGSQRLFLAPLPVGYAGVDRFYWQKGWRVGLPDFIAAADPANSTRFFTSYWKDSWKQVLGNYVTGLCDLGIDGVILDGIDSYGYFEAQMPF